MKNRFSLSCVCGSFTRCAIVAGVATGLAVSWLSREAEAQDSCSRPATRVTYLFLGRNPECRILPSLEFPAGEVSLLTVQVSVMTTPISAVRLSIPDPPVGRILSEEWNYPHAGARVTGIEFDLQGCSATGTLSLGEFLLEVPSNMTECHFWQIDGMAEVDDCEGQTVAVSSWYQYLNRTDGCTGSCPSWQWCAVLPAGNLSPEDGATGISLETQPAADGSHWGDLHITSDPACETWDVFPGSGQPWLQASYLQPATTYRWYVSIPVDACSNLGSVRSLTQSFTTEPPVSATDQPWGHIKQLFR